MGINKVRVIKKGSKTSISATPTFEFDVDLEERRSSVVNGDYYDDDNDDEQSIKSSASKASKVVMKKVRNILSFHKTDRQATCVNNLDKDDNNISTVSGNSKEKKNNLTKTTTVNYNEPANDNKSARNRSSNKKKKKKESMSTITSNNNESNKRFDYSGDDDNISVLSEATKKSKKAKKKKKKKKPSKGGSTCTNDDDISVDTTRSKRSSKKAAAGAVDSSTMKQRNKKNTNNPLIDGMILGIENTSLTDQRRMDALEEENAALLDETATIRRQLNGTEKSLKVAMLKQQQQSSSQQQQQVSFDQVRELEMAQLESNELKMEIEEYENAVIEKDSLIQKLTEAVDAQLDKVEYFEDKMERAEHEFCKMVDEMKEMEEIIEVLQEKGSSLHTDGTTHDEEDDCCPKRHDHKLSSIEIEQRDRKIDDRERYVLEKEEEIRGREILLQQEKEELRLMEQSHFVREREFSSDSHEQEFGKKDSDRITQKKYDEDNVDKLKAKMLGMDRELTKIRNENNRFRRHEAEMTAKEQSIQQQRNEELREIQDGVNKEINEFSIANEVLRKELDELKQQTNFDDKASQQKIRTLKKQKHHFEASSRHLSRRNIEVMDSVESIEDGNNDYELELEIAELREKIVEQEEHSRRQKQEISMVFTENKENKQELQEREIELRDLEKKIAANKETSTEKMTQKDETITFMQNEMMKIMQEKQQIDKQLRGEKLDLAEKQMIGNGVDEEEEKAKIEAINVQLRKLDDENRELEDKLKEVVFNNSLRFKEKQGIILNLQEELSDAKWELGAREKGADYITLLKDRKERKTQLDKARKESKISQERILELEASKHELEREIKSLSRNDTSTDSSDQESGLKRQIKSLKQHNVVLEQTLAAETRQLIDKDTKLKILEFELERFKTPTQTAIRGVFSSYSFGRKSNVDKKSNLEAATRMSMESNTNSDHLGKKMEDDEDDFDMVNGTEATKSKSLDSNPKTLTKYTTESSCEGNEKDNEGSKKKAGTGKIWSLFSPQTEQRRRINSQQASHTEKNENVEHEKESATEPSNELNDNELPAEVDTVFAGSEEENKGD